MGGKRLLVVGLLVGGRLVVVLGFRLVLLAQSLEAGHGNSVKVTHAVLADAAAALGVLLENSDTLEALDYLALHGSGSIGVVRGAEASVRSTTVELLQVSDTNGLAQVDVSGKRSSSHVEPVWVVWCLFLESTSLDNVDPGGDLDLACVREAIKSEDDSMSSALSC